MFSFSPSVSYRIFVKAGSAATLIFDHAGFLDTDSVTFQLREICSIPNPMGSRIPLIRMPVIFIFCSLSLFRSDFSCGF